MMVDLLFLGIAELSANSYTIMLDLALLDLQAIAARQGVCTLAHLMSLVCAAYLAELREFARRDRVARRKLLA